VLWRRALAGEQERTGVDLRPLAAVAALVTLLGGLGVVPAWAGLPHHVALPPLDLFADVRVLLAEAPSYPWFVGNLVAIVAGRGLVLAAMLRAVDRDGLVRSLGFYAVAVPVALVAGTLSYAGVAAVYSLFLWAAAALSVVALVVMGPIAWRPLPRQMPETRPRGRFPGGGSWGAGSGGGAPEGSRRRGVGRLGVVGYVGALVAVSLLSAVDTAAAQFSALWVSAGLTAVAARWLHGWAGATARRGRSPRGGAGGPPGTDREPEEGGRWGGAGPLSRWRRGERRGRSPLGGALLGLVLVAAALPAARAPTGVPGHSIAAMSPMSRLDPVADDETPPRRNGTLFLVPGIGGSSGTSTIFRLHPAALGFGCARTAYFSYAGTGAGAPQRSARCPITSGAPYEAEDTRRPVDELAATFRAQLAELEPPVVVVAHSQGGWVVAAGVDERAVGSIDDVVLVGAFPRHERGYVLDGPGRGAVGTDALEGLMALLRGVGGTSFDPRAPLPRTLLGTPGAVDDLLRAMPAELRVATVTSALDLPVMPPDWQLPAADDLCPLYVDHGSLPLSAPAHAQIRDHLAGGEPGGCPWWRRWPARAFSAFGAPP
jgi:hypothetical protein